MTRNQSKISIYIAYILSFVFVLPVFAGSNKYACRGEFAQANKNKQFIEALYRFAGLYKEGVERDAFKSAVATSVKKGKTGKEILRRLIKGGHVSMEHTVQNPLFSAIIARKSKYALRLIEENPELMYEGALLDNLPFFIAVFTGDLEIVAAFLKQDPELVLLENSRGEKPLHYAWNPKVMTVLLNHQAPPNAQDKKGMAALHYARYPETAEILLHFGADPHIRDRSGLVLLKYHEQISDNELVTNLLQEANAKLKAHPVSEKPEPVIQGQKKQKETQPVLSNSQGVQKSRKTSMPPFQKTSSNLTEHPTGFQEIPGTNNSRQIRIQKSREQKMMIQAESREARKNQLIEDMAMLETMEAEQIQILTGLEINLQATHRNLHTLKTSRLISWFARVFNTQANREYIETRLVEKITDINNDIRIQSRNLHQIQTRQKKSRKL